MYDKYCVTPSMPTRFDEPKVERGECNSLPMAISDRNSEQASQNYRLVRVPSFGDFGAFVAPNTGEDVIRRL